MANEPILPSTPGLPAPDDAPDAPDAPPVPPAAADETGGQGDVTLTPDQVEAFGMTDCQVGEEKTITVKCTGNDPETGCTVQVVEDGSGDEAPEADEAGSGGDDAGVVPTHAPKAPRPGLPDTRKMRDL